MSYLVFARKLRPQSFEEIIGQEPIVRTLQNAISQNRLAHAYLFSGIRGVGKTTTARILAKALNCQEGPTPQPCNQCDSCREISAGSSVDVYEIDAASNRGIDEARELRENVRYAPARGKYKVYIIDEAHMLTTPAFNALLKTLEEPPPHVVFVLCTTDYHKIPPTIISRCQHFDFRRIPHKQIVENLKAIAKMEGIEASDPSLHLIALSSEGSLRDAQSTLDQLISFSGKKVPHSEVVSLIGIIDRELLLDISAAIIEKNPARILQLVDKLIDYGYDPYQFLYELITHFRHMLVIKISPTPQELVNLPEEEFRSISQQASKLTEQELIRFLNILTQAEPLLKFSPQPRFLLEATLVKLVHLAKLTPIEEVITHLEELTERRTPSTYPVPPEEVREEAPPLSFAKEEKTKEEPATPPPAPAPIAEEQAPAPPAPEPAPEAPPPPGKEKNKNIEEFLRRLKKEKTSLAIFITDYANLVEIKDQKLILGFLKKHSTFKELIESKESLAIIEKVCREVLGDKSRVAVVFHSPPESELLEAGGKPPEQTKKEFLLNQALKEPRIQSFIDTFRGEVIDIKELK
ncbi:MAG: DNA polymerase III subunit gamma/tau [Candidatus Aminicenantes bacterium]|nr:DNA polymerase III subunit gamma/tau [Candidatus Aminicenantes bacterium]